MDYSSISDKELFDKLQQAGVIEGLKNSEEWKIIDEVRRRAIDYWTYHLVFKVKAGDMSEFERIRAIIRVWKYDLFRDLEIIKQEGEMAFEELKFKDKRR